MRDANIWRAYNAGCDARIAGRPLTACPHLVDNGERYAWRSGWRDVDRHWGENAKGPFKALPPVPEGSATLKSVEPAQCAI